MDKKNKVKVNLKLIFSNNFIKILKLPCVFLTPYLPKQYTLQRGEI